MKKAVFISSSEYKCRTYLKTWEVAVYNSHELRLEPYEGILTVKRSFRVKEKNIDKVIVRATALGIFDMYINGERIGEKNSSGTVFDELKPGWTDYRHRVFEFEYEITSQCGDNNLFVAEVSPGWWSGRISFGYYGYKPCAFCGEIEITYKDGSSELIATGEDWEAAICGPVMRADIWDGEYYDATIPHASVSPDVHRWLPAAVFHEFDGEIVSAEKPNIRVKTELYRYPLTSVIYHGTIPDETDFGKIRVVSKRAGDRCEKNMLPAGQSVILDMGQNIVGRPCLCFKTERGTKIEIFFAEMLNDSGEKARGNDGAKGSLYLSNYRSALARIVYIAAGGTEESFTPTHSFFGFRYIEIRADHDIELYSVVGEIIGSEIAETGEFSCDNPEINRLYSNIVWGMRGNYLSVPTDCPQRDERLGWTGDTQIFCGAASYMADIDAFMHKWLADARDSQRGYNGAYCDVIPRVFDGNNGNAAWGDACLIVPYRLWLMYGDVGIIRDHYSSMEEYMRYLEQFGLEGPNIAYGDWLNYDVTDKRYIAVCYYAYDALLMEKFSVLLGKTEREKHYKILRQRIIQYFEEKYLKNGELIFNTQTSYLLPLAFDMLEGENRENAVSKLREAVEKNDFTLSTGFVGTGILNQTLAAVGLDDLCYDLLLQTKDPSWLYSVRQGATTVWERWNSYTFEKGFGDVGMNSFNHYAYGAVAEWLYSGMCGILPDEAAPGFKHFILRPTPDMRRFIPEGQSRICSAKAAYNSCCGRIECGWKLIRDRYEYDIKIPVGTSARVELISQANSVLINGLEFSAEELNAVRTGNRFCFTLEAGQYTVML